MTEINHEILYVENPHAGGQDDDGAEKKDENGHQSSSDPYSWYDYDDMHPSNVHRFYPLSGLASGPSLKGPLTFGELAAAGLAGLGARSRLEAEKDMIQSPLFEQFVQAVKSKGFFMDPDNDTPMSDPEEERLRIIRQKYNYEDRYRKVVAKFRTKLAAKADSPFSKTGTPTSTAAASPMRAANWLALSSAERQRRRREQSLEQARWKKEGGAVSPEGKPMAPRVLNISLDNNECPTPTHHAQDSLTPRSQADHPLDIEQAERAKAEGNVFMQKKMYTQAAQSYTQALKISPDGPHSHVYFSNRAAALLSMKNFPEAILDSERSLALKPDYGKAHARLGLAHFLSSNYRQAMEAYTVSLKYDPNNASSKSYLEKAAKRLAESGPSGGQQGGVQSSFSLVSEWESTQRQQYQQHQPQPYLQQQVPSQDPVSDGSGSHRDTHREAEKFKSKGNSFMAQREYTNALDAYTQAIQCSPNGPQSHVYYSNRAASLCYLERYPEAVADSEKSLELSPTYGKAHARLGLSRFFLQDYAGAVAAYTAALEHDPDNAASKSYLAKAKAKLEGRSSRPGSRNASPSPSHRSHSRQPSLS
jgi:tetratricopeptide (TPR) repeat protein